MNRYNSIYLPIYLAIGRSARHPHPFLIYIHASCFPTIALMSTLVPTGFNTNVYLMTSPYSEC